MQEIQNQKVKEKIYKQKLENGLNVIIIPKKDISKKYIIWGTNFGSIDNEFIPTGEKVATKIPDGVAHFLEHKLFEQKNGTNSLDILSALGVDANAYTTNDHTAYLFEATDNFYEALDELMNYVQNPYFTDENVEKEKGIIAQEINMYDDDPNWQVYMNVLKLMYKDNPINIDIAGTVESINSINKEILYKAYNTFYNLSNMTLVACGDFEQDKLLEEIKKRITKNDEKQEIKRIYKQEQEQVVSQEKILKMEVNNPLYIIGFKDKPINSKEKVKKYIAVQIILYMLLGKSSETYKKLYEQGNIMSQPDLDYEFSNQYAHVLIIGQAKEPKEVVNELKNTIQKYQQNGLEQQHFNRIKKKIYGDYIMQYNDVGTIARMFLADSFKEINSFEYLEQYDEVTLEYTNQILKDTFNLRQMVVSIVKGK
ncbi:MAG: insulinase family protein [Clostridia bacterium]|jgi:predicted Zn-dependent peptidase|nr:insulinase family protein [Clostridia bacterium]